MTIVAVCTQRIAVNHTQATAAADHTLCAAVSPTQAVVIAAHAQTIAANHVQVVDLADYKQAAAELIPNCHVFRDKAC
jgi:hypothetical protein